MRSDTTRTIAIVFIAAGICLFALASGAHAAKLRVVTSFTVVADIAANVAGDAAEAVSITKPGA